MPTLLPISYLLTNNASNPPPPFIDTTASFTNLAPLPGDNRHISYYIHTYVHTLSVCLFKKMNNKQAQRTKDVRHGRCNLPASTSRLPKYPVDPNQAAGGSYRCSVVVPVTCIILVSYKFDWLIAWLIDFRTCVLLCVLYEYYYRELWPDAQSAECRDRLSSTRWLRVGPIHPRSTNEQCAWGTSAYDWLLPVCSFCSMFLRIYPSIDHHTLSCPSPGPNTFPNYWAEHAPPTPTHRHSRTTSPRYLAIKWLYPHKISYVIYFRFWNRKTSSWFITYIRVYIQQ